MSILVDIPVNSADVQRGESPLDSRLIRFTVRNFLKKRTVTFATNEHYLELSRQPLDFAPVTLEGRHLRLEPLTLAHHDALAQAGASDAIWAWYPYPVGATGMREFIETALTLQQKRQALPFVYIELSSGAAIGSSRFANIDHANRRAEIGWTWLMPAYQRTAINTEAKFLMLRHAFETLQLIRIEFKTDSLNLRSRAALARIGATEEGTFRNHVITHTGRLRHSVYFSVTDDDWPRVKQNLLDKLARSAALH